MFREGIRVTDPVRSILDAAGAGTAPEQIEMAVRQALHEGLTTRRSLLPRADRRGGRVADLIRRAAGEGWLAVRYETANAFRTALEQRLKNEAQATGVALLRLRKRVAFERFLARLATSESGGWVLKGAFALELRLGLRARTTKDIDLGRADDEEAATEHLNAATGVDLGDFFDFEVRRTPALDAATGFHAVRYTVRADLDGRRFEQFPVDVAFSEATPIRGRAALRRELAGVCGGRRARSCRSSRWSSTLPRSSTPTPARTGRGSGKAPGSRISSTSS